MRPLFKDKLENLLPLIWQSSQPAGLGGNPAPAAPSINLMEGGGSMSSSESISSDRGSINSSGSRGRGNDRSLSRSPSPIDGPNPLKEWDNNLKTRVLEHSHGVLDRFIVQNPGVNSVHTQHSLFNRVLAYRA